eukprot:EG_transcript_19939
MSVFRPAPRNASQPRVALLSGGRGHRRLVAHHRYHLQSKACYARLHGYSFILDLSVALPRADRLLPPHWVKVRLLQRWLPHFDWLFWTDLDTAIFRPEVPLAHFFAAQSTAHLIVPQDHMDRLLFSNDVFLLRNSGWSEALLARWWEYRRSCPDTHAEQGAMHMAMIAAMPEATAGNGTGSGCVAFCPEPAPRTGLYACVEAAFRRLAHPTGRVHFTAVDFPKGETGLCLNGFNPPVGVLQHEMPFCLHSRDPKSWATPEVQSRYDWAEYRCPAR